MARVVLVLVVAILACEADAAERPQVVYYNGQWWIVKSSAPSQHRVAGKSAEYERFGREVEQIVLKMNEVAIGGQERSDLRALAFLLRDYHDAVAKADWEKARSIARHMKVYLVRGSKVAADAGRRKAARARADAERRHREEMAQRAAILQQLQMNAALMRQQRYGR